MRIHTTRRSRSPSYRGAGAASSRSPPGFALLCLIVGYVIGNHRSGFTTDFTVPMRGTAAAPQASAVLKVGNIDASGNWPLELQVAGLKQLPNGHWYTLYLTKNKKAAESCGTFRVHEGTTTVRMNAPYDFRKFDGWIVSYGQERPAAAGRVPDVVRAPCGRSRGTPHA